MNESWTLRKKAINLRGLKEITRKSRFFELSSLTVSQDRRIAHVFAMIHHRIAWCSQRSGSRSDPSSQHGSSNAISIASSRYCHSPACPSAPEETFRSPNTIRYMQVGAKYVTYRYRHHGCDYARGNAEREKIAARWYARADYATRPQIRDDRGEWNPRYISIFRLSFSFFIARYYFAEHVRPHSR